MIEIIVDSCAHLTKKQAVSMGVTVLPMQYIVDGKVHTEQYSDDYGDYASVFKKAGSVSTAPPEDTVFFNAIKSAQARGNEVLCITISSRLSTAYRSAKTVANQMGDDVVVVDSMSTSGAMYLLVSEAVLLRDAGASLAEIEKYVVSMRDKTELFFYVDDMRPLLLSQRIGFVRQGVQTILNHKPLLCCKNGVVTQHTVARGIFQLIREMYMVIPEGERHIVITYFDDKLIADKIQEYIKIRRPNAFIEMQRGGPVIANHIGLNAIGVSFIN